MIFLEELLFYGTLVSLGYLVNIVFDSRGYCEKDHYWFLGIFYYNNSIKNLSKQKLRREEWLKKAWEFKEEIYKSVSGSWRMMGLSADWSREVFTLDPKCQKAVFEEFKTYYGAGLIYKGPYIVQWCPKDQTAIEDVEVEYEEREDKLYFIKFISVKL